MGDWGDCGWVVPWWWGANSRPQASHLLVPAVSRGATHTKTANLGVVPSAWPTATRPEQLQTCCETEGLRNTTFDCNCVSSNMETTDTSFEAA